jgi:hypothetical protein
MFNPHEALMKTFNSPTNTKPMQLILRQTLANAVAALLNNLFTFYFNQK